MFTDRLDICLQLNITLNLYNKLMVMMTSGEIELLIKIYYTLEFKIKPGVSALSRIQTDH